ncbi:hypothetical protein SmJEL517_g01918 [Synchytrium microbalum]|uniref:DNA polymerase V n=1 Tax=Synchytrium microbalum TaxID=1806994 RepID=A0A507CDY7_9FUNG|nr:uncharacterized protein SmJEL517_g01918 [Synchytrium microbalum]TPX35785.1 hypothetical protein SmJEL517_g01918 [Synchytrium microbalum]
MPGITMAEPTSDMNGSSTTLSLYWDLASKDVKTRTRAATLLIQTLVALQDNYTAQSNWIDQIHNDNDADNLELVCAPDVSYALKRLLRGLASSRQGARQGFAVALTELLTVIPHVRLSRLIELLLSVSEISGSMKSQEERDGYFGRIFGFQSFAISGIMSRSSTTIEDVTRMIDELIKYQRAKSYLRECCAGVFISIAESLSNTPLQEEGIDYMISTILSDGINNPEQLWIGLVLQSKYPKLPIWKTLLEGVDSVWEKSWLLHPANKLRLAELLKESSYSNPRLHGVWAVVVDAILSRKETKSKRKVISLADFWQTVVLDSLLSSTPDRKFVFYELFRTILPRLSPTQIPTIFTKVVIKQLMKDLSDTQALLHDSAKAAAKTLSDVSKTNPDASYHLVLQLIGQSGAQEQFDKATKTRTVANMMASMTADGFLKYVEYLLNAFLDQSATAEEEVDTNRTVILDQMTSLVRNAKIPKSEEGLWEILKLMGTYGLFSVHGEAAEELRIPTPALSPQIHQLCKQRLFTALGDLQSLALEAPKSEDASADAKPAATLTNGTRASGNTWAYDLNEWIQTLCAAPYDAIVTLDLDEGSRGVRAQTVETVKTIRKKLSKNANKVENTGIQSRYQAFELLFVHAVLQLHVDAEEATGTLTELQDCYTRVFKSKAAKSEKRAATIADAPSESEPQPTDVLVDILLSFLSRQSVLLRGVAQQAFGIFAGDLSKAGLDIIFQVLTTDSGLSGSSELFDTVDDGADDEDADMDDASDDGATDDDEETKAEESEDDQEANDEEDDDAEEEQDPELAAKADEEAAMLRLAIQSALAGTKHAEMDVDQDDEEEELLGDDEMDVFDDKVAEIFKARRAVKAEQKDAKQHVLHFKLRVVTLLEIYYKKQPTNPLVIDTLVPLLRVALSSAQDTDSQTLHNKVVALLRKSVFKLKKYPIEEGVTASCIATMREIHGFAGRVKRKDLAELCSGVCMVLIKVMNHQDGGSVDVPAAVVAETPTGEKHKKRRTGGTGHTVNEILVRFDSTPVAEIYIESLTKYMSMKRSPTQPLLFLDLINRYPEIGWGLATHVAKYTSIENVPRSFQLVQAYVIMGRLFQMLSSVMETKYKDPVEQSITIMAKCLIANLKAEEGKAITDAKWKEIFASLLLIGRRSRKMFDEAQVKSLWKFTDVEAGLNAWSQTSSNAATQNAAGQFIKRTIIILGLGSNSQHHQNLIPNLALIPRRFIAGPPQPEKVITEKKVTIIASAAAAPEKDEKPAVVASDPPVFDGKYEAIVDGIFVTIRHPTLAI